MLAAYREAAVVASLAVGGSTAENQYMPHIHRHFKELPVAVEEDIADSAVVVVGVVEAVDNNIALVAGEDMPEGHHTEDTAGWDYIVN